MAGRTICLQNCVLSAIQHGHAFFAIIPCTRFLECMAVDVIARPALWPSYCHAITDIAANRPIEFPLLIRTGL
jgi:hypothetical protein